MNIYNAKNNSMPEQVLENKENIELLNNVISTIVDKDIVIYDNPSGENVINDITLEIGATYEMFITSAVDSISGVQYGQQKITFKLIPAEIAPNNYDLYLTTCLLEVDYSGPYWLIINIYSYDTELWTISNNYVPDMKIYKIVKKAV